MVRPAALLCILALAAGTARAGESPCDPAVKKGAAWTTHTGCRPVPLDPADPGGPTLRLYYEVSRPHKQSAGTFIVLHGGPAWPHRHLSAKGPLWQGLRAHFTVLYYHQRGSGWSQRITCPAELEGREDLFTLDAIVHDTARLHEALLDGEPAVVMGKSAGGFIALRFALAHPDRVRALVLAATSPWHGYISQRERVKDEFLVRLDRRHAGFLAAMVRAVRILSPGFLANVPPLNELFLRTDLYESVTFDLAYTLAGQFEVVALTRDLAHRRLGLLLERVAAGRETLRASGLESVTLLNHITCREFLYAQTNPDACPDGTTTTLYDVRDRLHEVDVPVLVLSGRWDPILPPPFQEEIVTRLKAPTTWHILELSAHMLFREQPRATAAHILDFLQIPHQQPAQTPGL